MKLKRLVSAILAVGMALTMLPTAAFAADTKAKPQRCQILLLLQIRPIRQQIQLGVGVTVAEAINLIL